MNKAFSLIELLVSISIVGLLLVVSIPAFQNFGYRSNLTRSAEMIKSAILETQNLALAPDVAKSSGSDAYQISFESNSQTYQINEIKLGDLSAQVVKLLKTYYLPANTIFQDKVRINFSIVQQGKIVPYTPDETLSSDIIIKHEKIKETEKNTIKVKVNNATGEISIE